jgi:glycosyltransferase involved in cell wall biosynthesis
MTLTVLGVAYPFAPVGPDASGGAEQVLGMLDEALVARGHRSVVIAAAGSRVRGTLVPIPAPEGDLDAAAQRAGHAEVRRAIDDVVRRLAIDVVHMHGVDFHAYLPLPGPRLVVTLHLPAACYPPSAFHPSRTIDLFHCVSFAQRSSLPWDMRAVVIPNGVPVERLGSAARGKRGFALVLARVCPEKGIDLAVEACRRADVPLLIAGPLFPYPAHRDHFDRVVRPRLDRRRRYVGPVGWEQKRRLLARARCVLVTSRVPETSSLTAMEALSCGTPVVALRTGALAEIVEHGRTGFLAETVDGLAKALQRVETISSDDCRRAAREHFDSRAMVDAHLRVYHELAGSAQS